MTELKIDTGFKKTCYYVAVIGGLLSVCWTALFILIFILGFISAAMGVY
jgi:hypothetical protein